MKKIAKNAVKPVTVLALDLGGTKLAGALITSKGKISNRFLHQAQVNHPNQSLEKNIEGVVNWLASAIQLQLDNLKEKPTAVGISSAGPVHSEKGLWLSPTNFFSNISSAKDNPQPIQITHMLSKRLKLPVFLDNDAACAARGEAWVGALKKVKSGIVITLGTGVGVGVMVDRKILRTGHGLHPELGHLSLNPFDKSAPCGCGNYGCAEGFLSGKNFEWRLNEKILKRASAILRRRPLSATEAIAQRRGNGDVLLKGSALFSPPKKYSKAVNAHFEEYSFFLARFIHDLVMIGYPEKIILSGGFSKLNGRFLETTESELLKMLARYRVGIDLVPKLECTTLYEEAALFGIASHVFETFRK